jgi:glucokinase
MKRVAADLDPREHSVVSVGFAGPLDSRGNVLQAPTIWGTGAQPEPLSRELRRMWPAARIVVANDVSAAGYGFLRSPDEDFCVITVSSGIGHKIFIDGRPVVGPGGYGGEIGHVRIDFSDDAPVCDCGGRGHLSAFASGRATAYQATRLKDADPELFSKSSLCHDLGGDVRKLDNARVAEAFHEGDPWTEQLVRRMATPLGRALAGIHLTVGVERFVLMGGFASALGDPYLDFIADAARISDWQRKDCWRRMLELGSSGAEPGLLGAGRMAMGRAASWSHPERP